MDVIQVGFPLNEESRKTEPFVELCCPDITVQIGLTGLDAIINGLKRSCTDEVGSQSLSTFHVRDFAFALEKVQNKMDRD